MLTGLVRSTAIRHGKAALALTPSVLPRPVLEPVNKLTVLERLRILEVLTSPRFVDLAPLQVYAQLLDEGVYLCSVSTMYRVPVDNRQCRDTRRHAEARTGERALSLILWHKAARRLIMFWVC
ncbi:hypothetical protein FKR81_42950 [Lentzea tibetensis]|uniref:Uncharacterized protein n=1 Tax=Lentzea tibetensis TaxID=2591470 RepID=A0A563EEJ7_9PSEU|nr:hypothetical protein FKR81_42950 [Lentzea tibetensis]